MRWLAVSGLLAAGVAVPVGEPAPTLDVLQDAVAHAEGRAASLEDQQDGVLEYLKTMRKKRGTVMDRIRENVSKIKAENEAGPGSHHAALNVTTRARLAKATPRRGTYLRGWTCS